MSSAYEELSHDGQMGAATVQLLYETVAAVARIRRFPPPEGYDRWTEDAVVETAHDFLAERDGVGRVAQLFRVAFDQESFERLLHQAVRNHLRSRARATARGALLRRLRSVLSSDDRFFQIQPETGVPRWTLASTKVPELYTGPLDRLVAVGRGVEGLRIVRWRSTNRHGPVAERDSLARLCEEVLRAAGTSLRLQQLADVVAARFNLTDTPLAVSLDDGDAMTAVSDPSPVAVGAQETAEAIWEQLTAREQALIPFMGEPVRVAADAIGLGKSQTAVALARLREVVTGALAEDPDAAEVVRRLDAMAAERDDRTGR